MRTALVAGALAIVAGCSVPGPRDDDAARAVARTAEGIPAYEGQALLIRSCAGCHGEGLEGEARHGVPLGLDLDVSVASTSSAVGDLTRLDRAQRLVYGLRVEIWEEIDRGAMPPGAQGRLAVQSGPEYFRADGTPLPELDTPEGREIVRNWLRADAPLIERTQPRGDPPPYSLLVGDTVGRTCASQADCPDAVSARCDPTGSICVGCRDDADCAHLAATSSCDMAEGVCVIPAEPRFASIHEVVIAPRCATPLCHDGARDEGPAGRLDLRDLDDAYANLIGVPADGSIQCRGGDRIRAIPGDPEGSLLLQKLGGVPGVEVCGQDMPLSGGPLPAQYLEAIRQWIAAGAPND